MIARWEEIGSIASYKRGRGQKKGTLSEATIRPLVLVIVLLSCWAERSFVSLIDTQCAACAELLYGAAPATKRMVCSFEASVALAMKDNIGSTRRQRIGERRRSASVGTPIYADISNESGQATKKKEWWWLCGIQSDMLTCNRFSTGRRKTIANNLDH